MSLEHTLINLPKLYCLLKVKTHRMITVYSCKLWVMHYIKGIMIKVFQGTYTTRVPSTLHME
jgi:hypothetical protein